MKKAIEKRLQGLYYVPDHIKMQERCNKAMAFNPYMLRFVPDHFKMQGMCHKAVMEDPCPLECVPGCFQTQGMCDAALKFVPDHLKAQETRNKAVEVDPFFLQYVPDLILTQQQVQLRHDGYGFYDDNGAMVIKNTRPRKKELKFIAWHLSRWPDWCM